LANNETVLLAAPEKAICDVIATKAGVILRSVRQTRLFLEEDLRIEREALRNLDVNMIKSWLTAAPKKSSLRILTKTLEVI
jgi:hypothetical protein